MKKKTRITDWNGTWYWYVEGFNRSYEWNPKGFPDHLRPCFSWKWNIIKRPARCVSCSERLDCLSSKECILVLQKCVTLNEITGMTDYYEVEVRAPYKG